MPGLGRGAVGFITRSDIGPSRSNHTGSLVGAVSQPEQDYSDTRYDEWAGYNESLFKETDYDEEDKDAD